MPIFVRQNARSALPCRSPHDTVQHEASVCISIGISISIHINKHISISTVITLILVLVTTSRCVA